ncbi:FAD-dependent oxidoreductase [Oxalobacteraceae bacterium OTU3CAMAD1]|nr:FAD-dependent oxidoreductase [Oxalobacteraceae bacterium OTU3CAMAD1]
MNTINTDILICGAGAAGLTLAIDLARRHIDFVLVDKIEGPFSGSRGKGIQPRTLEIFEALGVADRMVAAGGLYPPQRKYRADGGYDEQSSTEGMAPSPAEPYNLPLMLPQYLTEGVLRDRLAELGHAPRFGHELTGFEQDGDGVTARLANADGTTATVRARYLVGADGGRSFVRKALAIDFPGESMKMRAMVADLSLTGLGRDAWHRWGEGAGQLGLCPLMGTDLFQLQMPVPLDGDIDTSDAALAAVIAARTGRADIALHAVHWRSVYEMSSRLADRYRVGRVFIAGDAAHIHPPTGGQGLNTSVQDAWNLGWKLAAAVVGGAPDALLDTYETERREVAAGVLGLSSKLLEAARTRGDLRRGRETRQLDLGYRTSPLAHGARGDDAVVRAGDRAPDAPCRGAAGQPLRLFTLLGGGAWTLLRYEPAGAGAIAPRKGLRIVTVGMNGELRDDGGHLRAAYGFAPGDVALIRPDGYIGALANGDAGLAEYIERFV